MSEQVSLHSNCIAALGRVILDELVFVWILNIFLTFMETVVL
jgi:hypothetical protein